MDPLSVEAEDSPGRTQSEMLLLPPSWEVETCFENTIFDCRLFKRPCSRSIAFSPQAALSLGRTPCNYSRFGARSGPSQTNQCHQHLLPLSPDFNLARHPTLIVFEGAARHRKGIECFDEISRHFPGSC